MSTAAKNIIAWIAVCISSFLACLWSFWGILENFHEGWYYPSFWNNISLMLFQYLLFAFVFIISGFIAIRFRIIGPLLFIIIGILIPVLKIHSNAAIFVFSVPLCVTGILFGIGKLKNKKWAYLIACVLPLIVILVFSIEPIIRVSQRADDKNYNSRLVKGNNVELIWAPEGPGWATTTEQMSNIKWKEANEICARLSEDGKSISDTALNIWRLPTVDEAVRSLTRNGTNAGGVWNAETEKASYNVMPDKEPPLWKIHSPIIYWWTSTEKNDSVAYRVVYNGGVQSLKKKISMGSLGFRAVKETK